MNNRNFVDLGTVFDEIFDAARQFREEFQSQFNNGADDCGGHPFFKDFFNTRQGQEESAGAKENVDYYPAYSYPPSNVFMTSDRALVFEFALAGFDEKGISLFFQGDYMIFSAKLSGPEADDKELNENVHYFKHRLKLKDIDRQKYFVPLDKYAQEKVKAVYKNGILRVTIPPKEGLEKDDGVRIEIVSTD